MQVFLAFFCFPGVGYFCYLNCPAIPGEANGLDAVGLTKETKQLYLLICNDDCPLFVCPCFPGINHPRI
jgi:hypothetical protein